MLVYFSILLLLEIIFIILGNKEKKYYKIFNGLFFGFFISIILYCIYSYTDIFSYDTGEWVTLEALFQSGTLCIVNLIIGVISFILQRKNKNKQTTSKKKLTIISLIIVSIISIVLILTQYIIKYNDRVNTENKIIKETLTYLNNKYGNSDFEIVEIDRNFADNGFIGTNYLENYDIYAIYKTTNTRFYIYLKVDDSRNILTETFDDRLISTDYSEKYFKNDDFKNDSAKAIEDLNKYLKEKNLNVNIDLYNNYIIGLDNDNAVPNDYGKIPSKEELYDLILDYHLKHDLKVTIDNSEIQSNNLKIEIKDYLITLANILDSYYNNLEDYKIDCHYNDNNGNFFNGSMTINKEYIIIKGNLLDEKIKK